MLTNATFWLQVTMKSLQILMNLKLKAAKKIKNKKKTGISIECCMHLQELHAQSKVACTCKNSPLYGLRKTKILNESICNISI